MMQRVLVANRGEIARRVFRACRELGIDTVAIYGDGEHDARHVLEAGDAFRIDSERSTLPYLDIDAIIDVARRSKADAVHPGYGFLAENPGLAAACDDEGIIFVGPPAAAIRAMGDKVEARALAAAAGVPIVPGSDGPITSAAEALDWGQRHGFPLALKAAAGGGGRGFRVAHAAAEVENAFEEARGEAERSFSNPSLYAERYIDNPRHVEIQLFADSQGTIVSLGERECSIQRRHQKLIEETPSPAVEPALRRRMADAAIALARVVGYQSAGTVEFLVDQDGSFYFLEMNTRIQVEHTITELVTGIDLVKEQLRVATGKPLSFATSDIQPRGHAIECRINAEDVARDFAPAPGLITSFRPPAGLGIRVDSAVETGDEILPAYDSLIAKVVSWGRDRPEAIARMERALSDLRVEGVPTTIPFHIAVMRNAAFRAGATNTSFLSQHGDELAIEAAPAGSPTPSDAYTSVEPETRSIVVEVGGRRLDVRIHGNGPQLGGGSRRPPAPPPVGTNATATHDADGADLVSPVQGTVVRIYATEGERVVQGAPVVAIEAMKMENAVGAHRDGTISRLHVNPGDSIKIGTSLATIE